MRVMVFVPGDKDSEAGKMPSSDLIAKMMSYNEELVKAGIMRDGDGLTPTSKAKRVRFSGADRTVMRLGSNLAAYGFSRPARRSASTLAAIVALVMPHF